MDIELQNQSDENVLVQCASEGDSKCITELIVRYTPIVALCAKRYSGMGPDLEDLMQEGMLALLNAIRTYNPQEKAMFKTYAARCINNRIISAITAHFRGKNIPLNFYIPLENADAIPSAERSGGDPQEMFILKEEQQQLRKQMNTLLSMFEMKSLELYLSGHTYEEIAKRLECTTKSVDNGLQRVRRKLQAADKGR